MVEPMEMTDEEFRLYQARQRAAHAYQQAGFREFAERVQAGDEDECSQMRLARFFLDPTPELTDEFITAWNTSGEARSAIIPARERWFS
jgi:hypothetical protein